MSALTALTKRLSVVPTWEGDMLGGAELMVLHVQNAKLIIDTRGVYLTPAPNVVKA